MRRTELHGGKRPGSSRLELTERELILQLDVLVLVLDQEHVHKQEGVPHGLGPCVVVEVNPHLCHLKLRLLDAWDPNLLDGQRVL